MTANSTSFKKGHKPSPNAGRKKGTKNIFARELREKYKGDTEKLFDAVLKQAFDGCVQSQREALSRLWPAPTAQTLMIEDEMTQIRELIEASNERT